jgi:putative membrane protein
VAEAEPAPFNVQTHFAWLRTRLSAERTLMSWDRTALSLIGFGFTIYQFFEKLQQATVGEGARRPEAARNLGLALVIAGTLGTFAALWQYYAVVRYLEGDEFGPNANREGLPHWLLPSVLTILLAAIGVITTIWMLARG